MCSGDSACHMLENELASSCQLARSELPVASKPCMTLDVSAFIGIRLRELNVTTANNLSRLRQRSRGRPGCCPRHQGGPREA